MKALLILIFGCMAVLSPAQDIVKMQFLPYRMIAGKYYDLTPIYSWMDQTANILKQNQQGARLSLTNPDEFTAQGWCGVAAPATGYLPVYQVFSVMDDGLLVQKLSRLGNGESDLGDPFFLTNYPGFTKLTDNQGIQFLALRTGIYHFTDTTGAARSVPTYDYGTPYNPPPLTPEQIAALAKAHADAKTKGDEQRKASQERALQSNQTAADKGDAYGLMRMGERYRDGDGVEKDLLKAREYLQKAADAGSPTARDELFTLKP